MDLLKEIRDLQTTIRELCDNTKLTKDQMSKLCEAMDKLRAIEQFLLHN